MVERGGTGEFVEAAARVLDVITAFSERHPVMTLAEVAAATDLARPTARRLLLTLMKLGYARQRGQTFELTPKILDLGYAFVSSRGLWDIARPHLEELVAVTNESSSMAELDGADIVYVARVAVPKLVALRVEIGTRFPAAITSQGKVLLAHLNEDERAQTLRQASRSGIPVARSVFDRLPQELEQVRDQGWALADEELAPGVRSIAAPVSGGESPRAAVNITVHAAETTVEVLKQQLPRLLETAAAISKDWGRYYQRPQSPHRRDIGPA